MKSFKLLLFVSFLAAMMSCKTKEKVFNPETFESPYIVFGNGGGFTGQVKTYYLTNKGDLYLADHEQNTLLGKVDKKITSQIFSNYDDLGLKSLDLNEPGNRYYFLEMKSKDSNHTLKWGRSPLDNQNLSVFYNILLEVASKFAPKEAQH